MNEPKEFYYYIYEDEMISISTKKITMEEACETRDDFGAMATIPRHQIKRLLKFYKKNETSRIRKNSKNASKRT